MTRYIGFDGHEAQQEEDELKEFISTAQGLQVRSYLEVGVAHGVGFHAMVTSLPTDGLYVGLDLPVDHPSGPLVFGGIARDLTKRGYNPMMVWGNSHDTNVIERIRKLGPFDLVYIDGDHSPEGVRQDWETYGQMGKVVAFHDIYSDFVPSFGVGKLWKSIKDGFKHHEITGEAGTQVGMGVGILWR